MTRLLLPLLLAVSLAACVAPMRSMQSLVSPLPLGEAPILLENQSISPLAQEEMDPIAQYAKGMQIDYAEAERRMWLQGEMNLVEHKVAEDEAYFASWTQHEPTFGLVVSFSAPDGEERIQKYLEGVEWADLVIVQESDITREELLRLRDQVVAAAEETGIRFGSGVNWMTGKVTLYSSEAEKLRESLEGNNAIVPVLDRVEFVQESGAVPAVGP